MSTNHQKYTYSRGTTTGICTHQVCIKKAKQEKPPPRTIPNPNRMEHHQYPYTTGDKTPRTTTGTLSTGHQDSGGGIPIPKTRHSHMVQTVSNIGYSKHNRQHKETLHKNRKVGNQHNHINT